MKKESRAFTLVELMIIIAIIAILTSIVISSLNQAKQKSRDERRVQDIATIQLALERYYNDKRYYPLSLTASDFLTTDFMTVSLTDPTTGSPYMYVGLKSASTSGCRSYHLGTKLEIASVLLSSDSNADYNSAAVSQTNPLCPSGATGFDGTETLVYDVVPKY